MHCDRRMVASPKGPLCKECFREELSMTWLIHVQLCPCKPKRVHKIAFKNSFWHHPMHNPALVLPGIPEPHLPNPGSNEELSICLRGDRISKAGEVIPTSIEFVQSLHKVSKAPWIQLVERNHLKPSPILDFGKIVIYTSNLKIIRTPMDKKELMRKIIQNEGTDDWSFMCRDGKEGDSHQVNGRVKDAENQLAGNQYVEEGDTEHNCSQCKGSGSAPCSLCHGSKFSMLANRFRESYRALRCPACNENGLQPCQVCAQ
ncbi:glutaredoxin domain-containing cysteine-rich protein 2 isoform X1 [Mauremys mutica]|uniref:glutaredoxin domain-containing cysteine-rich protein 2 isoform X1 n=1 Tax=Mauremys mutica TaxID=74926 RepID=UPI001D167FAA|nr:glutaredoxin domain-containing cysteine-rich protein 2 isoform X1 [Mauremys mutica]